jgi:uracil-DNA glycosylase family 4
VRIDGHLGRETVVAQDLGYNGVMGDSFERIQDEVIGCRRCPRLTAWREEVAVVRKRATRDQTYWGRPVPAFGDPDARVAILGLAPAAHGANRTGRQFTGDGSGDWLFRALHRAGFASQAESVSRDDGMALCDAVITSPVRCAPPGNKPDREEMEACRPFLVRELQVLENVEIVLALGGIAWRTYFQAVRALGLPAPSPRPKFGHGAVVDAGLPHVLIGSFHPSRLNTQTGRLTESMLDGVLGTVVERLGRRGEGVK